MTEIVQEPVTTDTSTTIEPTQTNTETTNIETPAQTSAQVITPTEPQEIKQEAIEEIKTEELSIDWKKEIAGDEKLFKKIDKYKTVKDLALAYENAQNLISTTRAIPELAADATPEEVAKYRETYGIPSEPQGYDIGENIPEEYKEPISRYLEVAHQNNRSPASVKQAVTDYLNIEDKARQALVAQITKAQEDTKAQLKQNWGDHYEVNSAAVEGFIKKTFGEDSDKFLDAYLPDGTKIRHNASMYSKLLDVSKSTLGVDTIIPTNLTQNVVDLQERLKTLNDMAASSSSVYWGANHAQFKQERDALATQLENIKKNRL